MEESRYFWLGRIWSPLSEIAKAYFTLRRPYPFDNADFQENEWPWNSAYPQKAAYTAENPCEMVTVGVANTINTYTDYKERISGGMWARDQDGNFIASCRSSTSSSRVSSPRTR